MVLRFRGVTDEAALIVACAKPSRAVAQTRSFASSGLRPRTAGDYLAMAELRAPVAVDVAALGEAASIST